MKFGPIRLRDRKEPNLKTYKEKEPNLKRKSHKKKLEKEKETIPIQPLSRRDIYIIEFFISVATRTYCLHGLWSVRERLPHPQGRRILKNKKHLQVQRRPRLWVRSLPRGRPYLDNRLLPQGTKLLGTNLQRLHLFLSLSCWSRCWSIRES